MRKEDSDELRCGVPVVLFMIETAYTSLLTVDPQCPYVDLQTVHMAVMLRIFRAARLADVTNSELAVVDSLPFSLYPKQHR